LFLAGAAHADDAHTWEDQHLEKVMAEEGLEPFSPSSVDRIQFVRIVRTDVFTPDDPWPDFLNIAHFTTVEAVVARELLFAPGDPFDHLEETARNLRSMFIFAFVRVVPVKRREGGDVGVLVLTRDLWSLRFEQGFQVTATSIDRLVLQLTERNVLGNAKLLSARFGMDPSQWFLGQTYIDPRVLLSHITALESVDVFFSRANGSFDGSRGLLFVGAPLLNLQQPWGFELSTRYDIRVIRQIRNNEILTWDAPGTPDVETIPRVWGQRDVDAEAVVHRQLDLHGVFIHRVSAGIGFSDDYVEPIAETHLPRALESAFRADVLPLTRRTIFPLAAVHIFSPRFRLYEDLDTFGVTEAVRLGPSLAVVMGAGTKALLSSSDTVFATGTIGVALDPFGGLFEAAAEGSGRWEDGRVVNRIWSARLRYATAPILAGRLLLRGDATLRRDDVTNVLVSLGGDNGLRGYSSAAFFDFGASIAQATIEWRSLPIDLWSAHIGVAAFYDVGSVFQELRDAQVKQSVGVGVRFLFPQLNRGVYRIDVAAPIDELGFRVLLSIGDNQAVEHARPAFDRLVPRR
jgi:hypothetical protein